MIDITSMPDNSRLWVYQANRKLSLDEEARALNQIGNFLSSWAAHGADLESGASIFQGTYVIIAVDEMKALASGCSVDKLARFMDDLGSQYDIDFFNRMLVGYMDGDRLIQVPLHQFWAMRKAGLVHDDTPVINTLVRDVGEWKNSWIQPFVSSWHQEMWSK